MLKQMWIFKPVRVCSVWFSIQWVYRFTKWLFPGGLVSKTYLTAKSENKKKSTSEKARIIRLPGWYEVDMYKYNYTSVNLSLPGE